MSHLVLEQAKKYMQFTSGSNVGDANEVVIYYRQAGATGWTDSWDIYTGTDCTPSTTIRFICCFFPSIMFQQPTVYELLVWDTAGDGSGSNAGGIVVMMLTLELPVELSQIRHLVHDSFLWSAQNKLLPSK